MFKGIILIIFIAFAFHNAVSQCYVSANPIPQNFGCFQSEAEAVWLNTSNVTVNGNSISKTSNTNNWDTYASTGSLIQNNMFVTSIVSETNTYRVFSLTSSTGSVSPSDNDFCFYLQGTGVLSIVENGTILVNVGNYSTGDSLKILADNGIVKYFQNSNLVYTSSQTPTFPMIAEGNLWSSNATIQDVILGGYINNTFQCTTAGYILVVSYQWRLNGNIVGTNSNIYTNSNLNDNDIINCTVIGFGICTSPIASNTIKIIELPSENMTAEVVPNFVSNSCVKAETAVTWENELNILFQGNDIARASGFGWGSAGIASSNQIGDNMYASTIVQETNTARFFGLSNQDVDANWNSIDFGVYLSDVGTISIYESGVYKGGFGNYNVGDTVFIKVENGIVNYYLNSNLFYVSNSIPNLPLLIDVSIYTNGGSIKSVKVSGFIGDSFSCQTTNMGNAPTYLWYLNGVSTGVTTVNYTNSNLTFNDEVYCEVGPSANNCSSTIISSNLIKIEYTEPKNATVNIASNINTSSCLKGITPVVWDDVIKLLVDNNNLTSNLSGGGWTKGAFSKVPLLDDMGIFTVINETNKQRFFGVSASNTDPGFASIEFAVYLNNNGLLYVYESGTYRGDFGNYAANDTISIQINNGVLGYYKNDNLFYTSTLTPTLPLFADVSFNQQYGTLNNVNVFQKMGGTFTCSANNVGANPSYQWMLNNQVVGNNSNTYTNLNLTEVDTLYCKVTPDINSCSSTAVPSNLFSFEEVGLQKTLWTGASNSNWLDAGNWNNGVPSPSKKAIIDANPGNNPTINGAASCAGLFIGQNNSLNVIGTDTLKVYGSWNNEGEFVGSNSNIEFNSNCLSTVGFYNAAAQNFNNIIINDGVQVNQTGSKVNLIGALSLENGSYNTNDSLVVISDANGTGRITAIKNGSLTGNIEMQRYIDAGATHWRFLTQAVSGQDLESFDDDFVSSGFPGTDFPNFPTAANPFSSFYFYNESQGVNFNDGFVVPSSTSDAVGMGQGIWIWCGDSLQGTNPFTIDAFGPIYQGDLNLPVTYTPTAGDPSEDGWNMVANPYPCTIDWEASDWVKNNIDAAIFIWNPDNAQYASYVAGVGTNLGDNKIASSQAFWVHSNAASPQLTIKESCKINQDHGFIKKAGIQPKLLRLKLNASSTGVWDETVIRMEDNTTSGFDSDFDALKFYSGDANSIQIASTINNKDFTINSIDEDSLTSIDLKIILPFNDVCTITATDISGIDNMSCVLIEDLTTGTFTDLKTDSAYQFQQVAYNYQARLRIHFTKKPAVTVTDISCYNANDGSLVFDLPIGIDEAFWSNAAGDSLIVTNANLSQGTYFLNYNHQLAACGNDIDSFVIMSPTPITVQTYATNINCISCCDGTANVNPSGGTAPYTYIWANNVNSIGNNAFDLCAGTYDVLIIDENNCDTTITIQIQNTLSIASTNMNVKMKVYPNPSKGLITIEGEDISAANLSCYNSLGQDLSSFIQITQVNKGQVKANLEMLPEGVYFLKHQNSTYRITKN